MAGRLTERGYDELWLSEHHLTATNAAVYASTSTQFVRVVIRVRLRLEHPVTIAEELSILDNHCDHRKPEARP